MIGNFRLQDQIGEGAFGQVWRAVDPKLDRLVAIKFPRQGGFEGKMLLREARAAAGLRHPQIIGVHEMGSVDGMHFLVSEYIAGDALAMTITEPRAWQQIARLTEQIARTIDHAHAAGVIHRDLKPSNIIIDPQGTPHIIDFGMAKRELAEETLSASGMAMGTPVYMSPEQARGDSTRVTPASDVYALGVILYQMLTRDVPFRGSVHRIIEQVLRDEPSPPRRFFREIPADLETICLKCLQKEPGQRYATAAALAEDLHRFQTGDSILARPVGKIERMVRWCRRYPQTALVMALVTLVALVSPLVAVIQSRLVASEKAARQTAETVGRAADRTAYVFGMNAVQQAVEQDNVPEARSILTRFAGGRFTDLRGFEWRYWRDVVYRGRIQSIACDGRPMTVAYAPDGKTLAYGTNTGEVVLWENETSRRWMAHQGPVRALAFSADGEQLATSGPSRQGSWEVSVWGVKDIRRDKQFLGHTELIQGVAFSPDQQSLASASHDGSVRIWSMQDGSCPFVMQGHAQVACSVIFSPDGQRLFSGGGALRDANQFAGDVIAWDPLQGKQLARFDEGHNWCNQLALTADEQYVVAGGGQGRPWLLDPETLTPQLDLASVNDLVIAVATEGERVFGAGHLGAIYCWELSSGVELFRLAAHDDLIYSLACDGRGTIASGSADATVGLWHTHAPTPARQMIPTQGPIQSLNFSDDGQQLLVGSNYETSQWQVQRHGVVLSEATPIRLAAHRAVCHELAIAVGETEVRLEHWPSGKTRSRFPAPRGGITRATCAANGEWLVVGGGQRENDLQTPVFVHLWGDGADDPLRIEGHARFITGLAISPDERMLAVASGDRRLAIYDFSSGQRLRWLDEYQQQSTSFPLGLHFSPDGSTLIAYNGNGALWFWDVLTWQSEVRLNLPVTAYNLSFAPDGRTFALATGARGTVDEPRGEVQLWDVVARERKTTFASDEGTIQTVAFSPDGRMLVAGHQNGKMTVWQTTAE